MPINNHQASIPAQGFARERGREREREREREKRGRERAPCASFLVSKLLLCFSRFGGPASGQEGLKAYFASRPHLFEAVVM
jgi:hypothetical protein